MVTIREITHAVQFSGAPWLRGHVGRRCSAGELLEGLQVALGGGPGHATGDERATAAPNGGRSGWASRLPDAGELRGDPGAGAAWGAAGLTLGGGSLAARRADAVRDVAIEGHAEHTMDAVGAEVLPSLPQLRAAMTRRRTQRGLPWRVLEKLLGLELKLRQYETGRRFCDAVVAAGGPGGAGPRVERAQRPAHRTGARTPGGLWTARMAPHDRLTTFSRPERTFHVLQARFEEPRGYGLFTA